MTYRQRDRDEHLANDGAPKRILALDGGGLRGILTLGILSKLESVLRDRHGGHGRFRLCDYFDLIAGTSTGSIIAATLALGWTVDEIRQKYMTLGKGVFQKSLLRDGFIRAKYNAQTLTKELQAVYGGDTMLGSPKLRTGLLVVTKRLDTGSPWPISNNPRGQFFNSGPNGVIGNREILLWQVVRASTAAPSYFDPESIRIIEQAGRPPVAGEFVDGGVSPFNNPALQAFMYATLTGYRLGWPASAEKLLLVSVGTGAVDAKFKKSQVTAQYAVQALLSLMGDCATLQETLLQWLSSSPTAREIDAEIGDLRHDLVAPTPLLTYLRYNVDLRPESVHALTPELVDNKVIESLSAMDAPENMEVLHRLGIAAAERDMRPAQFPAHFDLPK